MGGLKCKIAEIPNQLPQIPSAAAVESWSPVPLLPSAISCFSPSSLTSSLPAPARPGQTRRAPPSPVASPLTSRASLPRCSSTAPPPAASTLHGFSPFPHRAATPFASSLLPPSFSISGRTPLPSPPAALPSSPPHSGAPSSSSGGQLQHLSPFFHRAFYTPALLFIRRPILHIAAASPYSPSTASPLRRLPLSSSAHHRASLLLFLTFSSPLLHCIAPPSRRATAAFLLRPLPRLLSPPDPQDAAPHLQRLFPATASSPGLLSAHHRPASTPRRRSSAAPCYSTAPATPSSPTPSASTSPSFDFLFPRLHSTDSIAIFIPSVV